MSRDEDQKKKKEKNQKKEKITKLYLKNKVVARDYIMQPHIEKSS